MRRSYDTGVGYEGLARWRVHPIPIIAVLRLLLSPLILAAEQVQLPELELQTDTVRVRAQSARQADDGDTFFLAGDFVLESADWQIVADTALIHGALEDPDLIDVDGQPARIRVIRKADRVPVLGYGEHLQFNPRADTIDLNGQAKVQRERQSISAATIHYLVDEDTFSTGKGSRVRVVTQPK